MIKAYLNYPRPHMTIHADPGCQEVQKMGKADQRTLLLTRDSFARVVEQVTDKTFQLGSSAPVNDAWLHLDFEDQVFEAAVADHILRLLAKRYAPLQSVRIKRHCESGDR